MCAVWCGTLKTPLCPFKTPPCVDSKRPRVYRHHANMLKHMCAWCRYTRGRFERTHGPLPSPSTHRHTPNTTPTQHHTETDRERERRQRKREETEKERGKKTKEEREETTKGGRQGRRERRKRKKNSDLTCIRGDMHMSVSLFCLFLRENTIWNTCVP